MDCQDLIPAEGRIEIFAKKKQEVLHFEAGTKLKVARVFGTSIWDETLYRVCASTTFAHNADSLIGMVSDYSYTGPQ